MNERERRERRTTQAVIRKIQEDIHAIYEQGRAAASGEEPPQRVVIDASSELPPAIAQYYNAENRNRPSKSFRELAKLAIETVGVGSAIAAGIFTYQTLHQVTRQATAAEQQAIAARQGTVISQRAFVFFAPAPNRGAVADKSGKVTETWQFSFPIQNSGNTPTKNLTIAGRVFLDGRYGDPPTPYADDPTMKGGPRILLAPHLVGNQTQATVITPARIRQITTKPIDFYGWARYSDVFDISDKTPVHITMYCFQILSYEGDPSVPSASFNAFLSPCPGKHNCADDECDGEPYGNGQVWHSSKR